MSFIGITLKFECPACGNLLRTRHPFWTKKLRKNLPDPERCPCGRRQGFTLLDFEKCDFDVVLKEEPQQAQESLPKKPVVPQSTDEIF